MPVNFGGEFGPSSRKCSNTTKPPFNNVNARKAFAHAFNYMGFITDILGGYATRDPYPMPEDLWGIPKDAKGYDYDLKKAKEYMDKALTKLDEKDYSALETTLNSAQVLFRLGKYDEAREIAEKIRRDSNRST